MVPFSQGGSNNSQNLQTLCIDCNRGKGASFELILKLYTLFFLALQKLIWRVFAIRN
ncbi:MAG: hypothetical protein BRC51_08125 [Cyanobacteria bacterium SW_12_48_29]|nr:MAG: hypothetical protein BRC36_07905 [Cyanobacteria bacterium QH_2_48_84]PSP04223.1 MAG: hypothetical protein BRC51_08125 [Cyanobacteria bacterium SW_12_48_29]